MTEEEFDNIARNAFPEEDSTFESKYWNDMEKMLDGPPPRRGLWIRLTSSAILICGISGAAYWSLKSEPEAYYSSRIQAAPEMVSAPEGDKVISDIQTQESSTNFTDASPQNKSMESIPATSSSQPLPSLETKEEVRNQRAPAVTTSSSIQIDAIPEKPERTESSISPTAPVTVYSNLDSKNQTESQKDGEVNLSVSEPMITNEGRNEVVKIVPRSLLLESSSGSLQASAMSNATPSEGGDPAEPVKSKRKPSFFMEMDYHMSAVNKRGSSSFSKDDIQTQLDRDQLQDWQVGLQAGIDFGNIYLTTGINYRQLKQSSTVRTSELLRGQTLDIAQRDQIVSIDSTILSHQIARVQKSDGFAFKIIATDYQIDTTWQTVSDTVVNTFENEVKNEQSVEYQLNYVQLPLIIGYEKNLFANWLIEGFAENELAFLTSASGSYFDEETQQVRTVDLNGVPSMIWTFRLGAGLGYLFSPNLSLRLRPSFQQIVNGHLKSDRNLNGFNGSLALRLRF